MFLNIGDNIIKLPIIQINSLDKLHIVMNSE